MGHVTVDVTVNIRESLDHRQNVSNMDLGRQQQEQQQQQQQQQPNMSATLAHLCKPQLMWSSGENNNKVLFHRCAVC